MAGETIGFVGTGRMGGPMAGRLIDAGYSLCVYDTQSEATKPLVARGARLAKSPAEVASSARISCWPACRRPTSSRRSRSDLTESSPETAPAS